jgi:radical SAM protein with 4Fe4S-binding SPASM domain
MRPAPDYIQFYPTVRCNLACSFCYNRSLTQAKDMSFPEFHRLVDKLNAIGVRTLDIIGGEPTMHAELPQLIKAALQEGLGINLSSNGTDLIQLATIRQKHPGAKIGISVNDRKISLSVEDFIVKYRPIVKMVAGRVVDAVLVKRLLALKPKQFYLLYRDALNPEQLKDSVPFDQFWRYVQETYDPASVGTVSCSGFLPDYQHYPELLKARCPAGTTKLGIMPDGAVYPCNLFFGYDEFLLGNIFTDPFDQIWGHRHLTFFRTFSGNRCPRKDCELHHRCHGGCPAHSYAHTGNRSAPEPRCVTPR